MHSKSVFAACLVSLVPHLTSAAPASAPVDAVSGLAKRFAPGWCGVHVVQHQKPNPATDPYTFDITVKDAAGAVIGGSSGQVGLAGQAINQASQLPYVLLVTAGGVDADPVGFAYAGANWNSGSGVCGSGAYDSGSRQMDCGFTC